jgi:hypothetical protein
MVEIINEITCQKKDNYLAFSIPIFFGNHKPYTKFDPKQFLENAMLYIAKGYCLLSSIEIHG